MAKLDLRTGSTTVMVLGLLAERPMYGYQIVKELQNRSEGYFSLEQGTLYPALLKLEQEGAVVGEWGVSENNRRARFYRLTAAGRRQLARETRQWEQATSILARFLAVKEDPA